MDIKTLLHRLTMFQIDSILAADGHCVPMYNHKLLDVVDSPQGYDLYVTAETIDYVLTFVITYDRDLEEFTVSKHTAGAKR